MPRQTTNADPWLRRSHVSRPAQAAARWADRHCARKTCDSLSCGGLTCQTNGGRNVRKGQLRIQVCTIGTTDIADHGVTGTTIPANKITGANVRNGAITGVKIADNTILGGNIITGITGIIGTTTSPNRASRYRHRHKRHYGCRHGPGYLHAWRNQIQLLLTASSSRYRLAPTSSTAARWSPTSAHGTVSCRSPHVRSTARNWRPRACTQPFSRI